MAQFVCGGRKRTKRGIRLVLCLLVWLAFAMGIVADSVATKGLPQVCAEECCLAVFVAKARASQNEIAIPAAAAAATDEVLPAQRAEDLFPDYVMCGRLRHDTETVARNTVVRILEGESDRYYLVKSEQGDRMVVGWDELTILPPPARVLPPVSAEQIVAAVVERGY